MAITTSRSVKRAFRHTPQSDATPHGPILPATIQTSLLNVGMRIRKSVVEGYQSTSKPTKATHNNPTAGIDDECRRSLSCTTLVPYCGILRTGNLQHDEPREDSNQDVVLATDWDTGELPSNQKFAASVPSVATLPPRKRCHEDEDSDNLLLSNTLRSPPPQQTSLPHMNALRPILQPKTRKPTQGKIAKGLQESSDAIDIDDFEEATFLRFEDCMEENSPS